MKYPITLCIVVLALAACTSLQPVVSTSIPTITAATEAAVGLALRHQNPSEKTLNYVYSVASAIRSLSGGEAAPTVAELNQALKAWTGGQDTSLFSSIGLAISALYASYYPQIEGNPKLALQVLEAIAAGVENGAIAYQTPKS
jgi:hypothetical protein